MYPPIPASPRNYFLLLTKTSKLLSAKACLARKAHHRDGRVSDRVCLRLHEAPGRQCNGGCLKWWVFLSGLGCKEYIRLDIVEALLHGRLASVLRDGIHPSSFPMYVSAKRPLFQIIRCPFYLCFLHLLASIPRSRMKDPTTPNPKPKQTLGPWSPDTMLSGWASQKIRSILGLESVQMRVLALRFG